MTAYKRIAIGVIGYLTVHKVYIEHKKVKESRTYLKDYKKRKLDLDTAFERWKPSGITLISELRTSADNLDCNQQRSGITKTLGGVSYLAGCIIMPFLSLAGIGVSLGSAGFDHITGYRSDIQKKMNDMIAEQDPEYQQLLQATDEFKKMEQVKYKQVLSRDSSDTNTEEQIEHPGSGGNDGGLLSGIYNTGKAAVLLINANVLVKVAPYAEYIGMSNRAIKAKMIQEAVNVANAAKASGVTGAVGKALRLAEINKATNAAKLAKEGVKIGSWGTFVITTGYLLTIADIAMNIQDIATGSVSVESKNYRNIADNLENMIQDVEQLLSVDND